MKTYKTYTRHTRHTPWGWEKFEKVVDETLFDFIWKVDLILGFSSADEDKGSSNKKFLYLTFDDGPNFGSHVVLDAFKSAGSLQIAREVFK